MSPLKIKLISVPCTQKGRHNQKNLLPIIILSDTDIKKMSQTTKLSLRVQTPLLPLESQAHKRLKIKQEIDLWLSERRICPGPDIGLKQKLRFPPAPALLTFGRFHCLGTPTSMPQTRETVTCPRRRLPPKSSGVRNSLGHPPRLSHSGGAHGEPRQRLSLATGALPDTPHRSGPAPGPPRPPPPPSLTSRAFSCPTSPAPADLAVPLSSSPSPLTWLWAAMRCVFEVLFTSSIFMVRHNQTRTPALATRGPRVTKAPGARLPRPAPPAPLAPVAALWILIGRRACLSPTWGSSF